MCVAHLPAENEPPRSSALNKSWEWRLCRLLFEVFAGKKNPLPTATPNPKEESKVCAGLGFFLVLPLLLFFLQERERKEFICLALPKIKVIYGLGGGGYRALIRRIMSIDRGSTWINNN